MTSAEVKSSGRVENQSSILSYIKLDCLTTYNNKVALCDFTTTHNQSVKAFLIYFESQVEDFVVWFHQYHGRNLECSKQVKVKIAAQLLNI